MSKTLSIIIPTYNRASNLQKLLIGLHQQRELPDEIIIVDDHSTDHTRHIAREFLLSSSIVRYALNDDHHLAAARRTGMRLARGDYLSFIDDDVIIEDRNFIAKLKPLLSPRVMIQPKVIMENFGQQSEDTLSISDVMASRPYPILELITAKLNRGRRPRRVFPFNELGVFWHRSLNHYWIDRNLIGDAYGQSYSTALRLRQDGIKIIFRPELLVRHPGAAVGGSKKFNKKLMTEDFTSFHYDYFYNMIYLNARAFPGWIWLWLPYFTFKSLVALALNHNARGWRDFAIKPIAASVYKYYLRPASKIPPSQDRAKEQEFVRQTQTQQKIFVWQGGWRGGAERITLGMANFLHQKGKMVTLGVYQHNPAIPLPQLILGRLNLIPTSFRPLVASLIFRFRHSKDFSAVYSHKIGWWKTKMNQVFIHEAADLDAYQAHTTGWLKQRAGRLWRWLYIHLTLRQATIVFAATKEAEIYLKKIGVLADRIKPSASFYDERIFQFVKRAIRQEPIKLIFIGNPEDPRKNHARTKQLFYGKADFEIHVAGGKYRGVDHNFIYEGYLNSRELRALLTSCHIAVFPAQSEGFSIALLEALATGIPTIALSSAVNEEISMALNLVQVPTVDQLPYYVDGVARQYREYNVPDNRLKRFTRGAVLAKEYSHIIDALAHEPAPAHAPERKVFSETS